MFYFFHIESDVFMYVCESQSEPLEFEVKVLLKFMHSPPPKKPHNLIIINDKTLQKFQN